MAAHRSASSSASAPFTKGQVNRAGALLLDLRERMQRDRVERAVADFDERKLDEAWEVLAWLRSLYARPLSMVAADLRYHVDRADARVQGRIEVAQRLKRLETLIGKLGREPGNVTQMQDIGGVRAVLPSLRDVYVVRRRLLKSWVVIRERDYIAQPKSSGVDPVSCPSKGVHSTQPGPNLAGSAPDRHFECLGVLNICSGRETS